MFFTICIFLILFLIAWIDGKTKRIPDRLLAVLLAAEICAVPFFPEIEMAERGMGILCVSVPLLMLNLIRPGAFGGGDIKLSAVSGMFLGWRRMADAFLRCSWREVMRSGCWQERKKDAAIVSPSDHFFVWEL